MYVVTGGAGFIGSNLAHALHAEKNAQVIVVDDLTDGYKYRNMADCNIADYFDKDDFLQKLKNGCFDNYSIKAVFHLGACSSTTEWDGCFMMKNNYQYSKDLLHYCLQRRIPFVYASSAAVYGAGSVFEEKLENENPLNVYGYSKYLFDQYVRRTVTKLDSQVVGLRYFNVYGPRENHKGSMASVAYHFNNQIKEHGKLKLFEGCDGYGNGEQRRDFVFVEDVVSVNLWLADNLGVSGIYNVGTGRSQTFNDVANAVLDWHGEGNIEYIPFPDHLKGAYQSFTEANISALRTVGYDKPFADVATGTKKYLDWLNR